VVAVFVTLLCIVPIVYWNVIYDFITYRFHSERVTHTGIDITSFTTEVVGEVLYQNPVVYILMAAALFSCRKILFQQKKYWPLVIMDEPAAYTNILDSSTF
jgi:hypothetical protein